MVRLTDFEYNSSTLDANGFSFTVCPTTLAANSSYWLLRSFYEQDLASHISVRLDPFLWGPHSSFPQMMYKMVYAKPVNWDGIGRLREAHFGQMRADKPAYRSEVTEFYKNSRTMGFISPAKSFPPSSASTSRPRVTCTQFTIQTRRPSFTSTARFGFILLSSSKRGNANTSEEPENSDCAEKSSGLMSLSVVKRSASLRRHSSFGTTISRNTSRRAFPLESGISQYAGALRRFAGKLV